MPETEKKPTDLEEFVASQLNVLYPEKDSYNNRIGAAHSIIYAVHNHGRKTSAAIKEELSAFEKLARPLIQWLNENHNPHTSIIITTTNAEVVQGLVAFPCNDYIKD